MNSKRILVGLTGMNEKEVIKKIKDCDKLGITRAALFLEIVEKAARDVRNVV